jgi:hypothetical protein
MRSKYAIAPYVLEDEGGELTLRVEYEILRIINLYFKAYDWEGGKNEH